LVSLSIQEGPERVRRGDIPKLLREPLFTSGLREWNRYRKFGLAHGLGYLNERRLYTRAMEIFEQEYNDFLYGETRK
jgi:hypothetical protein